MILNLGQLYTDFEEKDELEQIWNKFVSIKYFCILYSLQGGSNLCIASEGTQ